MHTPQEKGETNFLGPNAHYTSTDVGPKGVRIEEHVGKDEYMNRMNRTC